MRKSSIFIVAFFLNIGKEIVVSIGSLDALPFPWMYNLNLKILMKIKFKKPFQNRLIIFKNLKNLENRFIFIKLWFAFIVHIFQILNIKGLKKLFQRKFTM